MPYFTAFIVSILSYFILSLGFVLQKKGINWIGHKERPLKQFKADRFFWITGFILVNISPLINFFALKEISSSVVTAISGLNIIFTIFLSGFLLNSKIYISDYIYAGLIAFSIAGIQLVSKSGTQISGSFFLYFFQILPILLFALYFLLKWLLRNKKLSIIYPVLLSLISGFMAGYMLVLMKLIQIEGGLNISFLLTSSYLYFYILCGILSFIAISMAYKIGDIMLISPIQYSSMVFYPFAASYCIFSIKLHILELIFFSIIILCVVLIIRNHKKIIS